MNSFKVSKITEAPRFDALPVAKITRYPLEKWDYKPYAQCIFCVSDDAATLRMWAFEVSPHATSQLRGVFYLYPDTPDRALCVDVFAGLPAKISLLDSGGKAVVMAPEAFYAQSFSGEDLQGVYWGYTVTIPLEAIHSLGGTAVLSLGDYFPGNFYKLCGEEPFIHSGSCFEADFTGNPYSRDSMGEMQVVAY